MTNGELTFNFHSLVARITCSQREVDRNLSRCVAFEIIIKKKKRDIFPINFPLRFTNKVKTKTTGIWCTFLNDGNLLTHKDSIDN